MDLKPTLIQRFRTPQSKPELPLPESSKGYYLQDQETQKKEDPLRRAWNKYFLPCEDMGAAEFEFGEVPKAFTHLAQLLQADEAIEKTYEITGYPTSRIPSREKAPAELTQKRTTTVHLLVPKRIQSKVEEVIQILSQEDYAPWPMKRSPLMRSSLFGTLLHPRLQTLRISKKITWEEKTTSGWLDLENLWFLTKNETQFQGVKILLGIPQHA